MKTIVNLALAPGTVVQFTYKNHKGETANRTAICCSIFHGVTHYHTTPQWFMRGFDLQKHQMRDFALQEIAPE